MLTNLKRGRLVLDEDSPGLPIDHGGIFVSAMEISGLNMNGIWPNADSVQIVLKSLHYIGPHPICLLTSPLRARFGSIVDLEYYDAKLPTGYRNQRSAGILKTQ